MRGGETLNKEFLVTSLVVVLVPGTGVIYTVSTGLFLPRDIKVRIKPFQYYRTGNTEDNFIHVFGNIMEERSTEQKAELSKRIVSDLIEIFPEVPIISINIRDFEKATYCNRNII